MVPYVNITRGVTVRENYFIPMYEDNVYDLRFSFPINFFDGDNACRGTPKVPFKEKVYKRHFESYVAFINDKLSHHRDEIKFAAYNEAMLGVSQPRLATL